MSSTRLPGKVLLDLCGRPVLHHVLERCAAIPGVDVVCCATVEGPEGDPIEKAAEAVGAVVVRGSLTDVLDRYYKAATFLGASVIVRVTSDCPLIDPTVCGEVVELRASTAADLACNNVRATWPYGLDCEVFTLEWLTRAAAEASEPYDREHVAPYIRNNAAARIVDLPGPGRDGLNFALDQPEDLAFLRGVVSRLPDGPLGWGHEAVRRILAADADLAALGRPPPGS
jgi:spore coat polysaccharide biosynthesis protein SpsF